MDGGLHSFVDRPVLLRGATVAVHAVQPGEVGVERGRRQPVGRAGRLHVLQQRDHVGAERVVVVVERRVALAGRHRCWVGHLVAHGQGRIIDWRGTGQLRPVRLGAYLGSPATLET